MKYDKATKETRTQHRIPDAYVNVEMTKTCCNDAADDNSVNAMMIN